MTTNIVTLAQQVAAQAHAGVNRADGTPFISHPAAVADRAATHYGADDFTIAAAWLHDVVEDTHITLADLANMGFPLPVLAAVDAVTTRDDEPYFDAVTRATRNVRGRIVKLCDNWHNSSTLAVFAEADRQRRHAKYARARQILLAA